jgi:hypothetical protein
MEHPPPLRSKKHTTKPAYYDDSLAGPSPVLKKNSSLPVLNLTTTFPPVIPRAGVVATGRPGSQQEMERSAAGVGPQGKPKEPTLGFYDGFCAALGIPSQVAQVKIRNDDEKSHKNTVHQLNESLTQIMRQTEIQVREAQRAATDMEAAELQLANFRASRSVPNDHPMVLTYITMWNHHSQRFKLAQREKIILDKRLEETRAYLEKYTAEEHQNKMQKIMLDRHKTAI